jgi:hypothetical protein
MAHFMGVGGAGKLIQSAEDNPNASAARMFPNAAAANQSIFYDRSGNARSVSQVYSVLNTRYAAAANSPVTQTALASAGGDLPRRVTVASNAAPVATAIDNAAYLSSFPDQRNVTPVAATSQAASAASEPMFRSLFQAGERTQPISPAIQELWGSNSSLTSVAPANPVAPATTASASTTLSSHKPEVRAPGRLDLFSDRFGTFSG